MRIVLGVLLLMVGFVSAVWLRRAFTSAAREESERSFGEAELELAPIPEGWGRAIVGAKSGVPPLPEEEARALPDLKRAPVQKAEGKKPEPKAGSNASAPKQVATPTPAKDDAPRTHTVVAGETLGRICAAAYGTSDKSLVAAVARANNLPSPDAIKVGQILRLPPREDLR
ncbi:MAG: LysM domain [Planctomycetota bacterium]|jgi:nucleoid-associated protein YgaU